MSSRPRPVAGYQLFVSDVSYYSGKLEAYLRYKQIPHERIAVSTRILREEILPATGVMKVPAMRCPDGRWLKDTTPMIQWLEQQHPVPAIFPADPAARFIALLVEDYADEWLWRPAMYYRWRFADSHHLLRRRLGRELSAGTRYPTWLLGWTMRFRQYLVFVHGDGVRPANEAQVRQLYQDTLAQLSALLSSQDYLLGPSPSIVDFAFFASMFRHFALDPEPARIMIQTAPRVYAWVARLWAARADSLAGFDLGGFSSTHWDAVFSHLNRQYLPYLDANAEAYAQSRARFDLRLEDATYPRLPTIRYRVACRDQLLKAYRSLDNAACGSVARRLEASGITDWLEAAPFVESGLDREFELPLSGGYRPPRGWSSLRLLLGTPWDMPAPPGVPPRGDDSPPPTT